MCDARIFSAIAFYLNALKARPMNWNVRSRYVMPLLMMLTAPVAAAPSAQVFIDNGELNYVGSGQEPTGKFD